MAQSGPSRAKSKKSSPTPKLIVTAVLAVVVLAGAYWVVQRGWQITEYNKILDETINQQHYEEAIPRLQAFIPRAQGDLRQRATKDLAACYLHLGDNPGLSMQQSAEYFKKAHDLDPASLDEQQRKIFELAGKQPAAE